MLEVTNFVVQHLVLVSLAAQCILIGIAAVCWQHKGIPEDPRKGLGLYTLLMIPASIISLVKDPDVFTGLVIAQYAIIVAALVAFILLLAVFSFCEFLNWSVK
jgi:hypothetical protein